MDSGRRARERGTSHPDRSKRNRKREEKEETAGAGGGRVGHGGKGLRGGEVGGGLFRPAWLCPAWLGRYRFAFKEDLIEGGEVGRQQLN